MSLKVTLDTAQFTPETMAVLVIETEEGKVRVDGMRLARQMAQVLMAHSTHAYRLLVDAIGAGSA